MFHATRAENFFFKGCGSNKARLELIDLIKVGIFVFTATFQTPLVFYDPPPVQEYGPIEVSSLGPDRSAAHK